jgi:microcystin-dependent protein
MSCDSCYNGCVETVSDECVRYTGIDYEALGVNTGDNLVSVEQAIMNALVPLLSGEGDIIGLDISCPIIDERLPAHAPNTKELFTATVSAICSLQAQIFSIEDVLAILNADYSIGCLQGVTASSDTHAIVQAIINKLCAVATELTNFKIEVNSNYVKLSDLNALIAAYLSEQTGSTQQYTKMVPYTAVEYYGPLTNFDGTGAGLVNLGWDKVYLCNGANSTPDKRGRVGVGAIITPGIIGPDLDAEVNPEYTGNPNYALYSTDGLNTVILDVTQLPSHTHAPTVTNGAATVTDPGHIHYFNYLNKGGGDGSNVFGSENGPSNKATSSATTGISVTTNVGVNIGNTGSGVGHNNIQPVLAAYYIMYIP